MVSLIRKQESNHKKVMKLLKGMINVHNHALGLQGVVDNELNNLQLHSSDIHLWKMLVKIYDDVLWCVLNCYLLLLQ